MAGTEQISKREEAVSAVDILLSRVKANPQRYTDNVGIQFCLALEKELGTSAVIDFFERIATTERLYDMQLTEQENTLLQQVGEKTSISHLLNDASYKSNVTKSLTNRRLLFRGAIGLAGGYALGTALDLMADQTQNVRLTQEVVLLQKEAQATRAELRKSRKNLQPILDKPPAMLTPEDFAKLKQHIKLDDKLISVNDELIKTAEQNLKTGFTGQVLKYSDYLPPALAVLGAGRMLMTAVIDETHGQAQKKFEDAVKTLDQFCLYHLGRLPLQQATAPAQKGR